MGIIHRIVFLLNTIVILLLLLSYLAPFVSPLVYWQFAFLGLGYPLLLLLNIIFIVYWLIFFKLKFMFSLAAIIIGFQFIPYFVQLNAKKTIDYKNSIRLVSFNVKYLGAFEGTKIENPDRFFDVLQKVNPDVLCFQEFRNFGGKVEAPMYKRLFKILKGYYHYNTFVDAQKLNSGNNIVIFSRFPIIDSGEVEHQKGSMNFTIFADIVAH